MFQRNVAKNAHHISVNFWQLLFEFVALGEVFSLIATIRLQF